MNKLFVPILSICALAQSVCSAETFHVQSIDSHSFQQARTGDYTIASPIVLGNTVASRRFPCGSRATITLNGWAHYDAFGDSCAVARRMRDIALTEATRKADDGCWNSAGTMGFNSPWGATSEVSRSFADCTNSGFGNLASGSVTYECRCSENQGSH